MLAIARARRGELVALAALFLGGLALRLAVCHHYVFAGSDSYAYLKLADEWRTHGRYALGPLEPAYFARLPLYPAFLALVKRGAPAEMMGGDGWARITTAQAIVDALAALLVYFLARKLAGRVAGFVAFVLALAWPFTVIACSAALTECVATALATSAVAAFVLGRDRPRVWFPVGGALIALSMLARADGALLALPAFMALILLRGRRERLIVAALTAGAFAVCFAPWPARNLARFGKAWPLGSRVDNTQHAVEHGDGVQRWLASFGRDWQTFNWGWKCIPDRRCPMLLTQIELWGGVDDDADRAALGSLVERRAREGLSEDVSRGFDQLAAAHLRRHPLRVLVELPLARAVRMWTDSFDEIFQKPPPIFGRLQRAMPPLTIAFAIALVLASVALVARRETRLAALVILAAVFGRTAVLAFTFFSMPRYIREVQPLACALVGAGLVVLARAIARKTRAPAE